MSSFRFRDHDSSTATTVATVLLGAVAGFAVGMVVAQRVGGFSGLTQRFRRAGADAGTDGHLLADHEEEYDEIEGEDEYAAEDTYGDASDAGEAAEEPEGAPLIEERVLEAFNNDPILAERAVDIGAMGRGIIELAGWVESDAEAEHAMTVARGVPGVDTVVNRLMISDEERQLDDNAQRFSEGDPALTQARWEGQKVGTGRRRQGNSAETDRHADPKPSLEERWQSEREAIRNAAENIDEIQAERRRRGTKARDGAPKGDEAEPTA